MNEESKRILNMLAEGAISADEAAMLLEQVGAPTSMQPAPPVYHGDALEDTDEKMLRVRVVATEEGKPTPTNVNINLPIKAARIAGRLIQAMLPEAGRNALAEQGFNLADINFDELIDTLEEMGGDIINVTHEDEKEQVLVRVYVG